MYSLCFPILERRIEIFQWTLLGISFEKESTFVQVFNGKFRFLIRNRQNQMELILILLPPYSHYLSLILCQFTMKVNYLEIIHISIYLSSIFPFTPISLIYNSPFSPLITNNYLRVADYRTTKALTQFWGLKSWT